MRKGIANATHAGLVGIVGFTEEGPGGNWHLPFRASLGETVREKIAGSTTRMWEILTQSYIAPRMLPSDEVQEKELGLPNRLAVLQFLQILLMGVADAKAMADFFF